MTAVIAKRIRLNGFPLFSLRQLADGIAIGELGRTFHLTSHRVLTPAICAALQLYRSQTTCALCRHRHTCTANPNVAHQPDQPQLRRRRERGVLRRCRSMASLPDALLEPLAVKAKPSTTLTG